MSENIIQFEDEVFKRHGVGFFLCPRCQEQSCFLPIVKIIKERPYISSLQCCGPYCIDDVDHGCFIQMNNGFVTGVLR